jgi:hypothetical protein
LLAIDLVPNKVNLAGNERFRGDQSLRPMPLNRPSGALFASKLANSPRTLAIDKPSEPFKRFVTAGTLVKKVTSFPSPANHLGIARLRNSQVHSCSNLPIVSAG